MSMRSCLSAALPLPQVFMDTFNEIARQAHSNDDQFYTQVGWWVQRGVTTHIEQTRVSG